LRWGLFGAGFGVARLLAFRGTFLGTRFATRGLRAAKRLLHPPEGEALPVCPGGVEAPVELVGTEARDLPGELGQSPGMAEERPGCSSADLLGSDGARLLPLRVEHGVDDAPA